jgi:hypothetical protein
MDVIALATGLLAGVLHVLAGPDHLAAVAPWAVRGSPRQGVLAGLGWGLGHAAGVAVTAALALAARQWISLDPLSHWSERAIGATLVLLGSLGLARFFGYRDEAPQRTPPHALAAIGAVHGLAGSSHLFGALPAFAFTSDLQAALYLLGLLAGSVLAMALFGAGLALLSARADATRLRYLSGATSATALGVGVFWLVAG